MGLDEFLKVLCKDRCECYWAIILLTDDGVLFQEWDDCEGLQAGWEGCLRQGLIEDLGENSLYFTAYEQIQTRRGVVEQGGLCAVRDQKYMCV